MNLEKEVFDIELKDIMPNRFQPREIFDEQELAELSKSITEHGVIQPIIVRKVGDKFEIIAGERRYRASLLAGKQTIPALVRDIDDKETAKIALLENLQRSNLTPIEEAKTYQTILKLDNITQEELANNLGKSQATVANKLRLLNLDEEVQTALLNKQISERHARSLLNITNNEEQKRLLNKVIINRMTVKQLDDEIMALTGKVVQEEPIETTENIQEIKETIIPESASIEEEPKQEQMRMNNIFDMLREKSNNEAQNTQEEQINQLDDKILAPSTPVEKPEVKINEEQPIEIKEESKQEEPLTIPTMTDQTQNYNEVYDLRFAINNIRQAVQNTEKFGFTIESQEFDLDNVYQIIIKINKDKF